MSTAQPMKSSEKTSWGSFEATLIFSCGTPARAAESNRITTFEIPRARGTCGAYSHPGHGSQNR